MLNRLEIDPAAWWTPWGRSPTWGWRRWAYPFRWRRFSNAMANLTAVGVDTETGGLDPWQNALLSVGFLPIVQGAPVPGAAEVHVIPTPGLIIEPQAAEVNGWTGQPVPGACHERFVISELARAAEVCRGEGSRYVPFLGHNVHFDEQFLKAAAVRSKAEWPKSVGYRHIDSCAISRLPALFGRVPGGGLDGLCRHFGLWRILGRGELGHKSPLADAVASLAVTYELAWLIA